MTTDGATRLAEGRQSRIAVLLGLAAIICLLLAHLSGLIGLDGAIRIGVAALGLLSVSIVVGSLAAATDATDDDFKTGTHPRATAFARTLLWVTRRKREAARVKGAELGEVVSLAKIVHLSEGSAMEFHALVRPRILAVANRRLRESGIDPNDEEQIAAVLGSVGVAVLDPLAKLPHDRDAPGVPARSVCELLHGLDQLR